jgi:hypothetical protein
VAVRRAGPESPQDQQVKRPLENLDTGIGLFFHSVDILLNIESTVYRKDSVRLAASDGQLGRDELQAYARDS